MTPRTNCFSAVAGMMKGVGTGCVCVCMCLGKGGVIGGECCLSQERHNGDFNLKMMQKLSSHAVERGFHF